VPEGIYYYQLQKSDGTLIKGLEHSSENNLKNHSVQTEWFLLINVYFYNQLTFSIFRYLILSAAGFTSDFSELSIPQYPQPLLLFEWQEASVIAISTAKVIWVLLIVFFIMMHFAGLNN